MTKPDRFSTNLRALIGGATAIGVAIWLTDRIAIALLSR